ncbi:MAG: recombinase family protein [Lachnospiraceae bacterium]|nr:recombinase family protein [Lachnospiraceae bacterium]
MKKRVIIYIRFSTARQAEEKFSIPQQREHLEKYCDAMVSFLVYII